MLSQFYAPVTGGQEQMVEGLARGLARNGHDVVVATSSGPDSPSSEERDGVRISYVRSTLQRCAPLFDDSHRRHLAPTPDPELTLALHRLIAHERPDVIHAHDWMVHSLVPLRRHGVAVCMTLHDYGLTCANKRMMQVGVRCDGPRLAKCLDCASEYYGKARGVPIALAVRAARPLMAGTVHHFLPVSSAVAAALRLSEHGLRYDVVPNFVPRSVLDTSARDSVIVEGLPPGDFVMFAGDATQDKGIDVLLEAARMLEGRIPVVVIGRCIADDISRPLPPNVHVLGPRPHDEVLAAWQRCAVAVVPSLWNEPFGLVALEAMALGRPVVASDVGGLADIVVHEQTGLLVPPGDVDQLATSIDSMMARPDVRAQFGQAGALRALEHFDERASVVRHEAIYHAIRGHVATR